MMDLTGDIEAQDGKPKKAKKVFPTKNLLSQSTSEEPVKNAITASEKVKEKGRRGRKPSFEGVETEDKFLTLPKTTTRMMGLAKLDLGYKTEQEFVNDAIVEFARKKGLS